MLQNQIGNNEKFIDDSPFADKGFYNFDISAQLPRHRWYYFKEGFSESLINEAVKTISQNKNQKLQILDPFCGSGTTPLTSSLLGHNCTGIEVNPFLAFVSKVKTTPRKWRRSSYLADLNVIVQRSTVDRLSSLEDFSTFTEREGLSKWLFNLDVLRKYSSIVFAIEETSSAYRDAFILAALVAAFDCSNVKRDGKGLRYKRDWKERKYSREDLLSNFQKHALEIIDDVEKLPIQPENKPIIFNADSRKFLDTFSDKSIDLVVTSPPYLNSFDYSDVYRPELFLGSYVKNNSELTSIRLNTIRSHVQVDWPKETTVKCNLLTPIINQLNGVNDLWNKRIPLMVQAYFDDLNLIVTKLSQKLKSRGQIWMVVSTSSYGGIHIPVDLILAELANDAGFTLEAIHRLRNLRTSGQQWKQLNTKKPPLRESLIILTKV